MPSMTLLPDGTGATAAQWVAVGEGTRHDCLDDNNGDTSYVKNSTNSTAMIITYADPHIAEADIASITSVSFISSGRSPDRRFPGVVDIAFQVPSGFSESCSFNSDSAYEGINGTTRTAKPDTTAWEYSDVENLAMICTKDGTIEVYLSYLAIKVDYTEAVTTNATFFGANF